ncbi:T9SS type A sorting domain-containing protein [Reichenbachiella carrageenanivorans]|uniref:T9SS type A sorting domain-containing protein n=1 Tax=Reichenbachiella carrageenanivorans TaxID=2979869 RepID=A0ABY6D1B0_9BACT|nr:T9SS type A sorting domain-containing protein [Reichenbachiella carrageenanivorans]UXX79704.1 T9SS type A sorting domain-containing protein [Reichenbachiella carrageenanivorans]
MKTQLRKVTLFALICLPFWSNAQTNRYVNPSGTDANQCNDPHNPCQTINYAIGQSSLGDIINLSEGTFASCNISERVTLSGRGEATIIQSMDITATTNGTNEVVVENVQMLGGASPGIDIEASFVTIKNVSSNGYSRNIHIDHATTVSNILINNCNLNGATSTGLLVNLTNAGSAVNGLTVLNTTMDNSRFGFYSQMSNATNTDNYLDNVIFRNCTFNNNTDKGFYIENLNNALFENISVINSGLNPLNGFNAGVDINLKWQNYEDIEIRNSRIIGCGSLGPNNPATPIENRRAAALTIKARTDAGSYNSPAASLTNLTLDGVILDGLVSDLRFGEMGKADNNGINMTTVTVSHCSFANDGAFTVLNEENNGTLTLSHNYWGGSAVDFENYGSSAATSQSDELANEIVDDAHNSYASISAALAGASSGAIIQNIPAGTIAGTTTVSQPLTLISPGAGYLSTDSRTTFENLSVNGGAMTMGSDFAVSGILSLTNLINLEDQNLMVQGTVTGASTIFGGSTAGLVIEGNGALPDLHTSSGFERVVIDRTSGDITLASELSTEWISLKNGLVDATAHNLTFTGNTALSGNDNSYVVGNFVHEVAGITVDNFLYFPVGGTYYRPVSLEGVDQASTTSYEGSFTESAPSGLGGLSVALPPLLVKLHPDFYWTVTPSTPVTAADKISLTYSAEDLISDPANLRIAQFQTAVWVNLGGDGNAPIATPASLLNVLTLGLGHFTLGDETLGSNFTALTDVYVSTIGDDSNDGILISTPKRTLSAAYSLVQAGGTINIANGSYSDDLNINKSLTLSGTGTPNFASATLNADITLSLVTADNVEVTSNGIIQDGIDLLTPTGTLTVSSGAFTESLSIDKSMTMNGANVGSPGADTRTVETVLDPGAASNAITVLADNVTIDGFQIGTDNITSNASIGIASDGYTGITLSNNLIYANQAGIQVENASSGTITVNDNKVNMLGLENAQTATTPSAGIYLYGLNGTVNAEVTNNDIQNTSFGIFVHDCENDADPLLIDGGTISEIVKGVEISNDDRAGHFAPSTVVVQNLTIENFSPLDTDVAYPDAQAGIYAFAKGDVTPVVTDDITLTMDNLDISGTQHAGSDYAAIYMADFQQSAPYDGSDDDEVGITATLSNSNIHDNENRAVYVRGHNAHLDITGTTFTNNGFDPNGGGYHLNVRAYASCTVSECYFTNPASGSFDGMHKQDANCTLEVTHSNFDQNGNGRIAASGGIDLSGNYFNTVDPSEINTWVNGNDFTPFLADGTDTDLNIEGFQPNLSGFHLTTLGAQTGGLIRKQEVHDFITEGGTIYVDGGIYTGALQVSKNLFLELTNSPSIANLEVNGTGKTLTVNGDLNITGAITMTDGLLNVATGTMFLSNTASAPIETATSYIIGQVCMDTRTINTGAIDFLGLNLAAGEDVGDIKIIRHTGPDAVVTTPNTNSSIAAVWDITVTSQPATTGRDVTFTWASAFDNSKDTDALSVFRDGGSGYEEVAGPFSASGSNPRVLSVSSIKSFSSYTMAEDAAPLPVTLLSFDVYENKNDTKLKWVTASEINSSHFEIEQSKNGKDFQKIGYVASHQNTNQQKTYTWVDQANFEKTYYRLKMVDLDGSYEYSKTVSTLGVLANQLTLFPNPVSDLLTVSTSNEVKQIEILDSMGRSILENYNQKTIDVGTLLPGLYLIRVSMPSQIILDRIVVE